MGNINKRPLVCTMVNIMQIDQILLTVNNNQSLNRFFVIYILSMGYIILYTFFLCGPITVRVYFLKTEKYPHFCRHCYPFRTYRTIQIWKAYSVLLLLLHKFALLPSHAQVCVRVICVSIYSLS
jgi:hypothetical protein